MENGLGLNIANYAVRRGDIFNVDLGQFDKRGSEQRGERPCIVVSNNIGNRNSSVLLVIPLTSQMTKAKLPTHVLLDNEFGLAKTSVALSEQTIIVAKERVTGYIGRVKKDTMKLIDKALSIALGLNDNRFIAEAKEQLSEVKYWERNVLESKQDNISKSLLMQKIIRFENEVNKLVSICKEYRLDIDEFYDVRRSFNVIECARINIERDSRLISIAQ